MQFGHVSTHKLKPRNSGASGNAASSQPPSNRVFAAHERDFARGRVLMVDVSANELYISFIPSIYDIPPARFFFEAIYSFT
jgi:hypothetical protein